MRRMGQSYLYDILVVAVGTVSFHVLPSLCPVSVRHKVDFLSTTTTITSTTIGREQLGDVPDKMESVIQIHNLLRLGFFRFQQSLQNQRKETCLVGLQKHWQFTSISDDGTNDAYPVWMVGWTPFVSLSKVGSCAYYTNFKLDHRGVVVEGVSQNRKIGIMGIDPVSTQSQNCCSWKGLDEGG